MAETKFLLVKRGLYYRPESRGYTGKKSEAGRFLESDASLPHGVIAIHEDDAAEYAPACWMETKLADKDARIAELEASLAHIEEPTPDQPKQDRAVVEAIIGAIVVLEMVANLATAEANGGEFSNQYLTALQNLNGDVVASYASSLAALTAAKASGVGDQQGGEEG